MMRFTWLAVLVAIGFAASFTGWWMLGGITIVISLLLILVAGFVTRVR
jgi:hypothetical protein